MFHLQDETLVASPSMAKKFYLKANAMVLNREGQVQPTVSRGSPIADPLD